MTTTIDLLSSVKLYKCEPVDWLFLPKGVRYLLGWITIELFCFSFLTAASCVLFVIPYVWRVAPMLTGGYLSLIVLSVITPLKEWRWFRRVGQLWYEILDFSCNKSKEELAAVIAYGRKHKMILCMHPHGILPIHAITWTAYCDQYLSDHETNDEVFGFGAAADVVFYVPILRNILGWLSAGSATYQVLRDGLKEGKCDCVNAAGRKPRHLYILPGGIAEIFTSQLGKHAIVIQRRRGLMKLAIETGAHLVPCYVFGGTDFFHNLVTDDGLLAYLSRKMRVSFTLFWGRFGLPIPYSPRVSQVLGSPIPPPVWDVSKGPIPEALIDELHAAFLKQICELFDTYKSVAGYPDAVLDVR